MNITEATQVKATNPHFFKMKINPRFKDQPEHFLHALVTIKINNKNGMPDYYHFTDVARMDSFINEELPKYWRN